MVNYINSSTKVKIICNKHEIFELTPNDHLQGSGCPSCPHHISGPETEWLDLIGIINDSEHRNVFLRNSGRKFKVDGYDPATNTIYEFNGDYWHGNPSKFKSNDINERTHCTFGELYQKTLEKERILKEAGYNIISIWESDFNSSKKQHK